jgi:dihydropteroate synthase
VTLSLAPPSHAEDGDVLQSEDRPTVSSLLSNNRTVVMGVINVTPDSFYDGGRLPTTHAACLHARQLVVDGADMLDVGGESSRPGAAPVAPEEEQRRILPLLDRLREIGVPVSVDTYHAATARAALAAGAAMINDITAFRGDPRMAEVVAQHTASCVLMHMQGTPQTMQHNPLYDDIIDDLCAFFDERLAYAAAQGIAEERIWLDPGFGFGKTVPQNLELLRRLRELKRFGRPLLIGTSNKSTIGRVLDAPVDQRLEGTAATVAVAVIHGADAVRVHDVRAMARVARMTDAILGRIAIH